MKRDDAFWAKVDTSGECWLWTGAQRTGYGRLSRAINGRPHYFQAHRYSLMLSGVELASGIEVDHLCHTRLCVRPAHLRLVTHKQNAEHLRGAHRDSKSGIRGVYWHAARNRWRGTVGHAGKLHQRDFRTLGEAATWAFEKRAELFSHNDGDKASA